MKSLRRLAVLGCAAFGLGLLPPAAAVAEPAAASWDPARAVLRDGDGWGSAEGPVTGGSAADAAHDYTVTTREELAAALAADPGAPRIIRVRGTIDANTDPTGAPLSCADYATDGYRLDAYLAAYDPDTWGDADPSGPLEEARAASEARQRARVVLSVPSDTTIVGEGRDARLLGATLDVRRRENVIVRNLTFEDTFDCFPQWDPTDGELGAWNSEYDSLVLYGSRRVWVDHNTFTDGRRPDADQPSYFGRPFQQHDGQLDVVRGSDLVTASWNVFTEHDKTLLIGNGDGAGADDRGRLRVTLHHNLFHNVNSRTPRVRFGQVDVYNNHFVQDPGAAYSYYWGVGLESALVAEYNAVTLPEGITPAEVIRRWNPGTSMTEHGNRVDGRPVDLLAAYNAANPDAPIGAGAGWTPTLRSRVDHPVVVPALVGVWAGAGRLPTR
ncbi:pectate lyase family protein [Streptomyces millisiae]|uniref:Pectate lyase n=1 Tax=Streptomyces millisiae TaxID=3075542 RepID=A0ABU2LNV7_9ACTN|nr:pectate lyase [Streptomyces sp. DSM 44918]MDT0319175.1 pectate lyase [Streptomyces sp. DSM 44918]